MLNFKEIENRIKKRTGLSEGKDIAALFKMTPQNYSNKKGLGTILPTIIEWAIQENVDLNWLLIGESQNSYRATSALGGQEIYVSTVGPLSKPKTVNFQETKKDSALIQQLKRIIQDGDKIKMEAVKATLKALDPGENK